MNLARDLLICWSGLALGLFCPPLDALLTLLAMLGCTLVLETAWPSLLTTSTDGLSSSPGKGKADEDEELEDSEMVDDPNVDLGQIGAAAATEGFGTPPIIPVDFSSISSTPENMGQDCYEGIQNGLYRRWDLEGVTVHELMPQLPEDLSQVGDEACAVLTYPAIFLFGKAECSRETHFPVYRVGRKGTLKCIYAGRPRPPMFLGSMCWKPEWETVTDSQVETMREEAARDPGGRYERIEHFDGQTKFFVWRKNLVDQTELL